MDMLVDNNEEYDNNLQGWILTIASGFACCLGASVVFSDLIFQKFPRTRYIHITQNKDFLVASLALGSGVMLYSSLYHLLPEAKIYLTNSPIFHRNSGLYLLSFYFLGVIMSAMLNYIIHAYLEESIHTHDHGVSDEHHHHHHEGSPQKRPIMVTKSYVASQDRNHNGNVQDSLPKEDCHHHDTERSPLLAGRKENAVYDQLSCDNDKGHYSVDSEVGSGSQHTVCVVESDTEEEALEDHDLHNHGNLGGFKHHHNIHLFKRLSPQKSDEENARLMRIGIQTALAISIHKFPEGLITFITTGASRSLGFALFFSIALHNISEGFTIALPLYVATRSRKRSFIYASALGGLSQPFGALIGWLFLRKSYAEHWDLDAVNGGLYAFVSGIMGLIVIQGMLPQAVKNDTSDGFYVSLFFFLGVLIMGVSSALFNV